MKEVVRAKVLRDDVKIDGKPAEAGEVREFRQLTVFKALNAELDLRETVDSNGVGVRSHDTPNSTFSPNNKKVRAGWEYSFGNDPREGVQHSFGDPEPALSAEFLGHHNRDVILPLLELQETSYSLERTFTHEPHKDYGVEYFTIGPVFGANLYGLNEHYWIGDYISYPPESGFAGKAMFMASIGSYAKKDSIPRIYLELPTVAADGLLRTKQTADIDFSRDSDLELVSKRLAEISVFFRKMPLDPEKVSKGKEEYSWLKTGFPLILLEPFRNYVYEATHCHNDMAAPKSWDKTIRKRYKFSWLEILDGLPNGQVKAEAKRIKDKINQRMPIRNRQ